MWGVRPEVEVGMWAGRRWRWGVRPEVEVGVRPEARGRGKRPQKAAVGSPGGRREICFDALVFATRAGNSFYRNVLLMFY